MLKDEEILKFFRECDFCELGADNYYEHVIAAMDSTHMEAYFTGATKLVVLFKDYPYAVKIPFEGQWVENFDEDAEFLNDFIPFEHAGGYEDEWDYCKAEVEVYREAKEEGLDSLFAETKLLGYGGLGNDHPIYIQEICQSYEETTKGTVEDTNLGNSFLSETGTDAGARMPEAWCGMAVKEFGKDLLGDALNFLDDIGINDFHGGNVGFRTSNMKPVILDYAGWADGSFF